MSQGGFVRRALSHPEDLAAALPPALPPFLNWFGLRLKLPRLKPPPFGRFCCTFFPAFLNWFGSFLKEPRDMPPPLGRFCGLAAIMEMGAADEADTASDIGRAAAGANAAAEDSDARTVRRRSVCIGDCQGAEANISIALDFRNFICGRIQTQVS